MNQNYIKFLSNNSNINYKTIINKIQRHEKKLTISINRLFNFSKKKYISKRKENFIKFSVMINHDINSNFR